MPINPSSPPRSTNQTKRKSPLHSFIMSPIVVTTSGEQDDSFSFFSPTSTLAAATPTTNDPHSSLTPAGFRMRRSTSSSGTPGQAAAAAAGTAHAPSMELQVDWDPAVLHRDLGHATTVLNHRGLKLAAKWTAEQWMGLPSIDVVSFRPPELDSSLSISNTDMTPQDWYAKTLLDVGEYLHAAYVLSATTTTSAKDDHNNHSNHRRHHPLDDVLAMPPPAPDSTSFGIYLRAYALYMAGERRKEEEHLELQSESQTHKTSRNPYLLQLMDELEISYTQNKLDAFGLYVYGLVLKEAQLETLTCVRPAYALLVESILEFPYNWSAWLDLAQVLTIDPSNLEPIVEQAIQPTLATNYMYHFFCAHLMTHHHQAHEDALILYERLYQPIVDQPPLFDSSYLKSQLGVVHYHLRDFEPALEWFHLIQDPYQLEQKDIYSNILYVREDKVALSQLAHQAIKVDKYRPETCCIIGNYYSLKQKRHKAVQYFQRALQLDRNYTSAWTLMGHEYVELKQTESAMEAYRRAVNVSPKDYRAWYGLGQTYEFLNMHLYALFYYRKAARLRPYDARMWCAVGLALCALHKIPDAIRAYERAVSQDDAEGIATQKLALLYRQEGRNEEAAQCYVKHLELRFLVTSTTGATTLSSSPSSYPSLDEIVQGVVVEAPEAEALLFLAHYHASHGEYDTAALLCSRLVEYPGPEKEQAKGLLRELRSRAVAAGRGGSSSSGGGFMAAATPFSHEEKESADFEFSP